MADTLRTKSEIKNFFKTGDKPTQDEFDDSWTSTIFEGGNSAGTTTTSGALNIGSGTLATGNNGSVAIGTNAIASGGNGSFACGLDAIASNVGSVQFGSNTNSESYSLRVSDATGRNSPRLMAVPPDSPTNGDTWIGADGHVYIQTNTATKDLTCVVNSSVYAGGVMSSTNASAIITIGGTTYYIPLYTLA